MQLHCVPRWNVYIIYFIWSACSYLAEWVCGYSFAGTESSNSTGGWICLFECCASSGTSLCVGLITRPEETYWGWSRGLDNEKTMAHYGLLRHGDGGTISSADFNYWISTECSFLQHLGTPPPQRPGKHYSYKYFNLYVFWISDGNTNGFEFEGNKHFPNSISSRMHLIISVVPNYVKFSTFSDNLLTNFMCNFVLDSVDKTQARKYLILSVVTLDGPSYKRIRTFLCFSLHEFRLLAINNHSQFRAEAELSYSVSVPTGFLRPSSCEILKRSWKSIKIKLLISDNPEEKTYQTTLIHTDL